MNIATKFHSNVVAISLAPPIEVLLKQTSLPQGYAELELQRIQRNNMSFSSLIFTPTLNGTLVSNMQSVTR